MLLLFMPEDVGPSALFDIADGSDDDDDDDDDDEDDEPNTEMLETLLGRVRPGTHGGPPPWDKMTLGFGCCCCCCCCCEVGGAPLMLLPLLLLLLLLLRLLLLLMSLLNSGGALETVEACTGDRSPLPAILMPLLTPPLCFIACCCL